ncbi:MAG: hypothetical protein CL912_31605 [Deltaproteobacteria bacterium]|nr:hypothetical protein [Deltaproteobacteria bacterium]
MEILNTSPINANHKYNILKALCSQLARSHRTRSISLHPISPHFTLLKLSAFSPWDLSTLGLSVRVWDSFPEGARSFVLVIAPTMSSEDTTLSGKEEAKYESVSLRSQDAEMEGTAGRQTDVEAQLLHLIQVSIFFLRQASKAAPHWMHSGPR